MRISSFVFTLAAGLLALAPFSAANAFEVRPDGTVCVQRPDGNCDIMSLEQAQAEEAARHGQARDYGTTVVIAGSGGVSISQSGYADVSCEQGRLIARRHVRPLGYRHVRVVSCDAPEYSYLATGYAGSAYVTVEHDGDIVSVHAVQ